MKHEFKKCLGCLEFLRQKHRYHHQKSNINSDETMKRGYIHPELFFSMKGFCVS